MASTNAGGEGPRSSGMDGERVVISGMSGLFPQSHHVKDLSNILYNKVNPISSEGKHWKYIHPEVPQFAGSVPQLDRFDAQFFGVHFRLGNSMDTMSRKMLEQTYQAIYDAGLSPEHLSGKKIGVYVGTCFSETEKASFYVASSRTGFGIAGCSKAMFANRISYWLNAKGPSVAIDEACCSSTAALEQAYLAMSRGECEAAIVGGANLSLHPQSSVHYARILKLCMDGKTKSFDENADGCAKSEAINVLFLQKAKDALRIYADVLHVKSEFLSLEGDSGPRFGFYRDPLVLGNFLKNFYNEAGVSPEAVEYVEAFGSASPESDKAELEAISDIFCQNRKDPLLVGSVLSNIGYAEAASGISAVTKVLLGYHEGKMAANLHCTNPRKDVPALQDGRIQIVTDHQPCQRGYTAVNSISVTGCNAHVLLHGHYKPKDPSKYKTSIPYLVTISGRHEAAVKLILDDLKSRPIDPEELALLHNIHEKNISGHLGRGFTILDTNAEQKTVSLAEACEYFDNARRPLWFVYSGMGSQWAGMGAQLMRIPVFMAAIERCRRVLQPKGIDIVHIITSPDKTIFDNILHSFVGIAAVQIGLTDILRELGLVPDKIIGHSVGELGCAYADGCFTAEEMILSAYHRGLVSVQTPFIHGSMAAVGIGYQQIISMVPPEIEVACHNSADSSTISGPVDVMKEFVATLTAKGIFAKEVPCSNIAYHSRYIADAGPGLLSYLSEVIKNPKPRSEKWLSTSVPQDKWNEPSAKYSSAEYHTNNLLNPVLFEETSRLIPSNAMLVEIAPHGLLQAILKRSLPATCKHVPLTRRGHPDNTLLVLEAVGKLYLEGYNPKVEILYPKVEFPVSTGTPFLSHLVQWAHNEKWDLPLYSSACRKIAAACNFIINLHEEEHKYLRGNVIRGKNVYPYAACLVAAWDTLAMTSEAEKKKLSVSFHDVHLFVQPLLNDRMALNLSVVLHRGTGRFEIMDGNSKVATGLIVAHFDKFIENNKEDNKTDEERVLSSEDIYQIFYEREYFYKGEFQSLKSVNKSLTKANIEWNNNWVTIIDGIIQLNALRQEHNGISHPAQIRSLVIDVKEHLSNDLITVDSKPTMSVEVSDLYDRTRCGGIVLHSIKFNNEPQCKTNVMPLKTLKFIPRFMSSKIDIKAALQIFLQILAENANKNELNVLDVDCYSKDYTVIDELDNIPGLRVKYSHLNKEEVQKQDLNNTDLLLIRNLITDKKILQFFTNILPPDAFVVIAEKTSDAQLIHVSSLYRVVASYNTGDVRLSLARWKPAPIPTSTRTVTVLSNTDLALLLSKRESLSPDQKLIVVTTYPPINGMKDLIVQWRLSRRNHVYLVMVNHKIADEQTAGQVPDFDLTVNVLEHGSWGGVYYVPLEKKVPGEIPRNISLQIGKIGDLNSLYWAEVPEPSTDELTVTVNYAALNSTDAKRATGVNAVRNGHSSNSYGMDFSGETESGVRVMGIVPSGACSRRVKALPELIWPVPQHWSMEEAASVPLPYAHAFYCLAVKSQLIPNRSILVHGGAGALGQAAISIALGCGLRVFTTVSDTRKKYFLRKLFPELKEDHIGNSRDLSFVDMVKRLTKGYGVDYVLNCLKGELKNGSIHCCAHLGVFLDTNQITSQELFSLGMNHLNRERNYITVDFSSIFSDANVMKKLQLLVNEGISRGYVRPLSFVTYEPNDTDAARALRMLEASRHRGRVLLKLVDALPCAQPRLTCSPDHCQLVLCDEEFSGLQLADRLIARGAKKLFLHAPRIPNSFLIKERYWQKQGVKAKVTTDNLSAVQNIHTLLKEANDMASVEGIYFVSTVNNKVNREVLSGLEILSRKLCTSIKYFAVISTDKNFGNRTCIARVQDQLAGTKLTLPLTKKTGTSVEGAINWTTALNTLESAVRSCQPITYAISETENHETLLQKIAGLTGMDISETTPITLTLNEIGITQEKIPPIAVLLRDEYNISLTYEDIIALSIQSITEIDQIKNGIKYKEIKGLGVFYSHVDADELMASTEIVFLPTLTSSAGMRDDEVDMNQTNLCIVPGLEGHFERFRSVCEQIKIPALVLQPGLDLPNETIQDLANRYAKILLKRTNSENNFYLLGYEVGVLIVMEIASILEDHGLTGTIYCIGAAWDQFQKLLENELGEFKSDELLQEAVIRHVFSLILGSPCELEFGDSTWEEKVGKCVRALAGRVPLSAQYVRALFDSAYGRLAQARQYKPRPVDLRSKIVVLRANSASQPITESELVQQHSLQPVAVHDLDLPLAYSLKDLRCAAVINQYLHPDILQEFQSKNLCETYLVNAETFMQAQYLDDDSVSS